MSLPASAIHPWAGRPRHPCALNAYRPGNLTYGRVGKPLDPFREPVALGYEITRPDRAPTVSPLIVRAFSRAPQLLQASRYGTVPRLVKRAEQTPVRVVVREATLVAAQVGRNPQLERDENGVVRPACRGPRPRVLTRRPGWIILAGACVCDEMFPLPSGRCRGYRAEARVWTEKVTRAGSRFGSSPHTPSMNAS